MAESAILTISDWHFGKRTHSFNPTVAAERLTRAGEKANALLKRVSAGTPVDEIVVALVGDIVDGGGIYPTQAHHQAITDPQEQARKASDELAKLIRTLKKANRRAHVRVEAVAGNHGRVTFEQTEANNYDIATYELLRLKLVPDQIPVEWGAEDDPLLRKISVKGHSFILHHGQDIGCYSGVATGGLLKKAKDWLLSDLAPFDGVIIGHFHGCGYHTVRNVHLYQTGTAVTADRWARRRLGSDAANRWWLFGVEDEHPVTWQYPITLT